MPLPDPETLTHQTVAGGGHDGSNPISPMLPGEWKRGMPCHWTEQTREMHKKAFQIRIALVFNFAVGVAYLIYRATKTIGKFTRHPVLLTYQIFFFVLELLTVVAIAIRFIEMYSRFNRNAVDFKRIPNELLVTTFAHGRCDMVRPEYSNYPSVAVFIPCYNESADLVLETVLGALAIDYPSELLSIYLCDDGRDDTKCDMIAQLSTQHHNIYYVTRPDNSHAKAGNLNYAIERTRSDLIVTLDADFVARPNILQRLVPYYYVWNPESEFYEFNDSLAVVQTPQHYRNLSPYDSDPFDQRSIFFTEAILPGKCYWNASTMVGTTNLINRAAITEAGMYPYHSITEDTAMSLAFHAKGYRTYYVNESLATGLACTSLWSNLGQRARWLKGDYQILFNRKKSPLSVKGLTFIQRLLYIHITYCRLISIINLTYEIALLLLLVFSITPVDVIEPIMFMSFLGCYLMAGVITRLTICSGGAGHDKSEAGSAAFEAIFRYATVKGLIVTLLMGQNLRFKVTDKRNSSSNVSRRSAMASRRNRAIDTETLVLSSRSSSGSMEVPGESSISVPSTANQLTSSSLQLQTSTENLEIGESSQEMRSVRHSMSELIDDILSGRLSTNSRLSTELRGSNISTSGEEDRAEQDSEDPTRKSYFKQTKDERALHHENVRKNLKRVWFNILSFSVLLFAIVWAFIFPPLETLGSVPIPSLQQGPVTRKSALLQIAMAIGFGLMNILPHVIAIFLCFIPYTLQWEMTDLVHGRCDQYAQHPGTGRLFVPWSYISLLPVARTLIMFASIAAIGVFILRG